MRPSSEYTSRDLARVVRVHKDTEAEANSTAAMIMYIGMVRSKVFRAAARPVLRDMVYLGKDVRSDILIQV